ncbi:hypothetical protein MHZ92_21010 [Sporosarcina sp. ACRSL]|uniref:hypothetical protein n=1 Tax=Sporosarcina sp. ACRSL TaxID=2918215 RepID=UPI001EF4DA56|nr:hypothetical protein [Sporosarcina sp. ACRSL]MCG7346585.1 hypothetical protein [Sporosarcina sp. ACRSL]
MKNKLKNVSILLFGLCVALVLSPSNIAASEDDSIVNVNVLSQEVGKSSVLDVDISDVQIVGDVNVNIPSEPEDASDALATVEVSDSVLDELNISVLENTDSKAAAVSVDFESSLTDEVEVDIVSSDKTADSFDGGVVEVNAKNQPLLGETHVGVLDTHSSAHEDGRSISAGLSQTDVDQGLLDNTSVNVLATEKAEDMSTTHEMSAVVDISVEDVDGIADDLDVSLLKRTELNATDASESKASLASVELGDEHVDVASSDSKTNAFDGGLVEVEGEDVPLLGETHVGVLDMHTTAGEEGKTSSSGLIQTDVGAVLLEDKSVGVLVRKMVTTEDGHVATSSGASLDLGLPETDTLSADVLKRERQYVIAINEPPSVVVPPVIGEDGTEESTEESNMPNTPDAASSDGNEDGTVPNLDQETGIPSVNVDDSTDDFSNEEEGAENNRDSNGTVEEEWESAVGTGLSGGVDADSGSKTGNLSGTGDASAFFSTGQSNVMTGLAMNNADPRSSLPKTGGFWDGERLAFLALFLVGMGFAMRRMGKSTTSVA